MKVLVAVKRVIDHNMVIRVSDDHKSVNKQNMKMSMNPFDEIAVEEAVRLKESGHADEVVVLSIGEAKSEDTLRTALAMGADRGILVETDKEIEPLCVAKVLSHFAKEEDCKLVITGKQAIDDDANQTAQMTAALLGCAQATFVSNVEFNDDSLVLTREIDGGSEILSASLPCVISVDLRLNEPRFASLPNIMKAKKKQLDRCTLDSLSIDSTANLQILEVRETEERQGGEIVSSTTDLIEKLKTQAKVI